MPRILQRNPDGTVLYEQHDGSVVTLPEYALPPDAVDASADPGAPAPPDPGPVPDVAWQPPVAPEPGEIEMPNEDIGGGEIEMPGEPADTFGGAPPAPDAVSGADPAAPLSPTTVDPYPPEPQAPRAPRPDPYQQQAAAQLASGAVAKDLADDTVALQRKTQSIVAPIEQMRAEAAAKIAARQAELAESHAKAVEEQANFDLREPKSSVAGTIRKILALTIGVAGHALSRSGGQPMILGVLERKAKEAAEARVRRYSQLGTTVKAKADALDRLGDVAKSQDAYYQLALATEWDKYAKELANLTIASGGDKAMADAAVNASGTLVKRDEALRLADEKAWNKERDEAKLMLDAEQTAISRYNAQTSRGQLSLGRQQLQAKIDEDKVQRAFQAANLQRLWYEAMKSGDQTKASQLRLQWDKAVRDIETTPAFLKEVPVYGPDGKLVKTEWKGLTQADGKPYRLPNEKARAKVDEQITAVMQIIDSIDRVQELRNQFGSEVDFLKSPEWRQLQANFADAAPTWAQYKGLGVLNGPDLELFQKAYGTNDPTEIRNIDVGLQEARKIVLRNMNNQLPGYTGEPFDIPNLTSQGLLSKADETEAGKLAREATASAKRGGVYRQAELAKEGRRGTEQYERGGAQGGPIDAPYVTPETASYTPTRGEEERIQGLVALAKSGDASARAGLASLIKNKVGAVGSAAAAAAVREGIDLSVELGPDEWAKILETGERARSGRLFSGAAGR